MTEPTDHDIDLIAAKKTAAQIQHNAFALLGPATGLENDNELLIRTIKASALTVAMALLLSNKKSS